MRLSFLYSLFFLVYVPITKVNNIEDRKNKKTHFAKIPQKSKKLMEKLEHELLEKTITKKG